jgi:hypothetical protein
VLFRFHRCIKLTPGLRLNFSKRGRVLSAGVRGFRTGIDTGGRPDGSVETPDTALSWRAYNRAILGTVFVVLALVFLIGCLVVSVLSMLKA